MLTTRRRAATRGPRPTGDAGTTLAELVVCMALTTVVGALALTFFVTTGRSTAATATNTFTQQNARTALTVVSGLVRLATPNSISSGYSGGGALTGTRVGFAANDSVIRTCPYRPNSTFVVRIDSGTVFLDRTGPQNAPTTGDPCAYRSGVTSTRVLVSGAAAGTAFSYNDAGGAVTTAAAKVATVTLTLVVVGGRSRTQTYTATSLVTGGAS